MQTLVFHNPEAGEGDHAGRGLLALLRKAGFSPTYCSTKGPDFPGMLRERAELFIAAGGDGTVGKVLKQMPNRGIPVAILPLGTANNIARSLGIAGKPKALVSGLQTARRQRFDIGSARGPWGRRLFVEGAGVGPLTEAMARIDSINMERADGVKLGRETFRKALSQAKPIRLEISIDGRPLGEEVLLAEILNIRYAGPGIALAPEGGLGDGLFDVVCIEPRQRADMLAWLGVLQPDGPAPATLQQGRKIALTWEGSPLRLDDDYPSASNRGNRITVELERDPVTILVPKQIDDKVKSKRGRSQRSKSV